MLEVDMRGMRNLKYVMVLLLVACGGNQKAQQEPEPRLPEPAPAQAATPAPVEQAPLVAIPDAPQPEPPTVLAVASLPNPVDTLTALEALAAAMGRPAPATDPSALLGDLSQEFLGTRIAGLDLRQPIYVLMLDPQLADLPFVLVGTVASRPALVQSLAGSPLESVPHRGQVAIGGRAALVEVAPHALSMLARSAAPQQPMVSLRITRIESALGPQIEEQLDQLEALFEQLEAQAEASATTLAETEAARDSQRSVRQMLDLARVILRQGRQLQLTLQPTGAPTLELTLAAEPDTRMQEVFAAIDPSDLSLVRLHGDAEILFGGRFDVDAMPEEVRRELSGRLWPGGTSAYAAMKPMYQQWYELTEGELVIAVGGTTAPPPWMVVRQRLEQPAAAMALLRKMGARGFGAPAEMKVTYKRNAFRHRGVTVDRINLSATEDMAPDVRRGFEIQYGPGGLTAFVTVVGDQMVSAAGEDARGRIETIIEQVAADELPAVPEPTADALAESRRRAETFVLVIDARRVLGPTAPEGRVALGVGFTDESMTVRFTLPAEQPRMTRMR
jgi:hypothetical protein